MIKLYITSGGEISFLVGLFCGIGGDTSVLQAKLRKQSADYYKFSNDVGIRAKNNRLKVVGGSSQILKVSSKINISSSESYKTSLTYLANGKAGLDERRKSILYKVPESNTWGRFEKMEITPKDLAYLSAYTGHEFALWTSKTDSILCHGVRYHCNPSSDIEKELLTGKYKFTSHTHVDSGYLEASSDDRKTLKLLNQKSSILISAITGEEKVFYANLFGK